MPFHWYGRRCTFTSFLLLVLSGRYCQKRSERAKIIIPNCSSQHGYSQTLPHSGTIDQAIGIKPSPYKQTIVNASSEQEIRAIGIQGNNETTIKINIAYILDSGNRL